MKKSLKLLDEAKAVQELERAAQYQSARKLELAEQSFLRVVAFSSNSVILSQAYRGLAKVARKQGSAERARIHIEQALALDTAHGDHAGMAADYEFLGGIFLVAGKLEQAEHAIREVLELQPASPSVLAATAYGNLGIILQRRGESQQAKRMFLKSLGMARKLEREDLVSTQHANLAFIYSARGHFIRASILLESAAKVFEKLQMQDGLASASRGLQFLERHGGPLRVGSFTAVFEDSTSQRK